MSSEDSSEPDRWEVPPYLRRKMRGIARDLRLNPTPSEDALWQALRRRQLHGRKFRRQVAIGPFIVDFFCPEERIAVEVDGPVHDLQPDQDQRRQELLESLGICVLRFKNEDVDNQLESVLDVISSRFNTE